MAPLAVSRFWHLDVRETASEGRYDNVNAGSLMISPPFIAES
jgi:hypothetical protein